MSIYIFFRGDMFYPVEYEDDEAAKRGAEANPGTTEVQDTEGRTVWKPSIH